MRFFRFIFQNSPIKNTFRLLSAQSKNGPFVRVVTLQEERSIKISFSNSSSLTIKAPENQDVSSVLSMIKLKFALLRQREEMRQALVRKISNVAHAAVETSEDYEEVCLFNRNDLIDERTSNIEAWSKASSLKVGDVTYNVYFNTPVVRDMSLPKYIMAGCYVRPHFMFDCATFEDCVFTWYRSVISDCEDEDTSTVDWVKVGDDFNYLVSPEDVDCYLKLVCSPRDGDRVGLDFVAVSSDVVESVPQKFPFEERQEYTKTVCGSSRVRCISYNTLANMYVEKRKFPYASDKAREVYYRKQLLTKEILGYNSDVICLQEVQDRVYEYDFYPVFKKAGFDGFYVKKGGKRHEGLVTFFRSSKFRVLSSNGVLLNQIVKEKDIFVDLLAKVSRNYKDMSKLLLQSTALQIALLENKDDPHNKILIANTHLYSNKDTPEVRLIQAALCVYYLEHLIKEESLGSTPILFCGDFNSLPDSEAYNFITSGNFECCPSWKNTNMNSTEDTTLRHNLNLESACGIPSYTNFTEEFHGCLDYIFYSKNSLEVTDIVPMPSHEKVTAQVGLPSEYFPSDHIALVCTLKWK